MHECECGHKGSEHEGLVGRCGGECVDPEYGVFLCMCHTYKHEDDQ